MSLLEKRIVRDLQSFNEFVRWLKEPMDEDVDCVVDVQRRLSWNMSMEDALADAFRANQWLKRLKLEAGSAWLVSPILQALADAHTDATPKVMTVLGLEIQDCKTIAPEIESIISTATRDFQIVFHGTHFRGKLYWYESMWKGIAMTGCGVGLDRCTVNVVNTQAFFKYFKSSKIRLSVKDSTFHDDTGAAMPGNDFIAKALLESSMESVEFAPSSCPNDGPAQVERLLQSLVVEGMFAKPDPAAAVRMPKLTVASPDENVVKVVRHMLPKMIRLERFALYFKKEEDATKLQAAKFVKALRLNGCLHEACFFHMGSNGHRAVSSIDSELEAICKRNKVLPKLRAKVDNSGELSILLEAAKQSPRFALTLISAALNKNMAVPIRHYIEEYEYQALLEKATKSVNDCQDKVEKFERDFTGIEEFASSDDIKKWVEFDGDRSLPNLLNIIESTFDIEGKYEVLKGNLEQLKIEAATDVPFNLKHVFDTSTHLKPSADALFQFYHYVLKKKHSLLVTRLQVGTQRLALIKKRVEEWTDTLAKAESSRGQASNSIRIPAATEELEDMIAEIEEGFASVPHRV